MSDLTEAERETLAAALRQCRVEDGVPVRLIRESDIFHVTHMAGVAVERILAARLTAHEARVTMLAATFTRYAEEMAALPPVGATGRLDAMDRREAAVWARAAGMVLAVLDEASA